MTDKIHGQIGSGEHLGKNLDFWTIHTAHVLDIAGDDVDSATPTDADSLDRLVQFIGQRAQTIMVSTSQVASHDLELAPYSFGSNYGADAVSYTLRFSTEHTGAWNDTASAVNNLEESLEGFVLPITLDNGAQSAADTDTILTAAGVDKNTTVIRTLVL